MRKKLSPNSDVNHDFFTPAVAELVAIAAAVGANCEPCFKYHYSNARKLGIAREDIVKSVELADRVKRAPAQNMRLLVDKILGTTLATSPSQDPHPKSCCSPAVKVAKTTKKPRRPQNRDE